MQMKSGAISLEEYGEDSVWESGSIGFVFHTKIWEDNWHGFPESGQNTKRMLDKTLSLNQPMQYKEMLLETLV